MKYNKKAFGIVAPEGDEWLLDNAIDSVIRQARLSREAIEACKYYYRKRHLDDKITRASAEFTMFELDRTAKRFLDKVGCR